MAYGVFVHKSESIYDDIPSERYQFPEKCLSFAKQCVNDWIIYLEPRRAKKARGYFAVARVERIIKDPNIPNMYQAVIESGTYLDFGVPVPFNDGKTIAERGLLNDQGQLSGRKQFSIRTITPEDFSRIVGRGLGSDPGQYSDDEELNSQIAVDAQKDFDLLARKRLKQVTNRAVRDQNFRSSVLRAYENQCAITGLQLINGGGSVEAEAAHILPVKHNGPDIVSNGIALSRTAHWMFDRGLIGLSEDLEINVSRQSNNRNAIGAMINKTGHLLAPDKPAYRPRPEFIAWHQENCFKG